MAETILTGAELKKEGFYWVGDTSDNESTWTPCYVEKDVDMEEVWLYTDPVVGCGMQEEIGQSLVFIGPIAAPSIAVPYKSVVIKLAPPVSFAPPVSLAPLVAPVTGSTAFKTGAPPLLRIVPKG